MSKQLGQGCGAGEEPTKSVEDGRVVRKERKEGGGGEEGKGLGFI